MFKWGMSSSKVLKIQIGFVGLSKKSETIPTEKRDPRDDKSGTLGRLERLKKYLRGYECVCVLCMWRGDVGFC